MKRSANGQKVIKGKTLTETKCGKSRRKFA